MALGGTIEYFRDAVFNYPTMAEAYKVAAHDGSTSSRIWRARGGDAGPAVDRGGSARASRSR